MTTVDPPSSSFFVAGGTLAADAPSYVEREADRTLQATLRSGEYCFVLDSRQIGKSSLLVRAMRRLQADGIRVALCDLQRLGTNLTVAQWYRGLLVQIGRGVGRERELLRYWQEHAEESPFERWRGALRELLTLEETPVVVLVDEIDFVRSLPFSVDEFFVGVRSFFTDRAIEPAFRCLTFCLVGSATPDALIQNAAVTPFNIGRRILPTDFTSEEAAPFARALSVTGREGTALLTRILYWTSGHPYLTQRLCRAVSERPEAATAADIDRLVAALYFGRDPEDGQHVGFINRRIEEDRAFLADPAGLLSIYALLHRQFGQRSGIYDDPASSWHALLKLSGLVCSCDGMLEVRNRIYHTAFGTEWINEHMPDGEARRQKEAVRRAQRRLFALWLAAFLFVGSLAAFGAWQFYQGRVLQQNAARSQYMANMVRLQWELERRNVVKCRQLLRDTDDPSLKGPEWFCAHALSNDSLFSVQEHSGAVTTVDYSPDGTRFLSGGEDGRLIVWDTASHHRVRQIRNGGGAITSACFSPDGGQVLTGASNGTTIQDIASGATRLSLPPPPEGNLNPVCYSPDGKSIATAGKDHSVTVTDATSGKQRFSLHGHTRLISTLCFSPDRLHLVSGSDDGTVIVWNLRTGAPERQLVGHKSSVNAVRYSPDGRWIVTGSGDKTAAVWEASTGRRMATLAGHQNAVVGVSFSPDGRRIATASWDHSAFIWNATSGKKLLSLYGHSDAVNAVAFARDGASVLTGSGDTTVVVWSAVPRTPGIRLPDAATNTTLARFSPDGQQVLTVGEDGEIVLRSTATGQRIATLPPLGTITSAAFAPDGKSMILTTESKNVLQARFLTGKSRLVTTLTTLHGHLDMVQAVACSLDGKYFVTGSNDGTCILWNAKTGKQEHKFKMPVGFARRVCFTPDSTRFAAASNDKTITIWNIHYDTPKVQVSLNIAAGSLDVLCFSPDAARLAIGRDDGTVTVLDTESGNTLYTATNHFKPVTALTFSPDGKRIVSGSMDRTAVFCYADNGQYLFALPIQSGTIEALYAPNTNTGLLTCSSDNWLKTW